MWHTKPISFSDSYLYIIAEQHITWRLFSLVTTHNFRYKRIYEWNNPTKFGKALHYQTICHILAHVNELLVDPGAAAAALSFLSASNPILELLIHQVLGILISIHTIYNRC